MKKIYSRLISWITAVVMALSVLCISACAAGAEIFVSDHYNVVVDKPVTVTLTVKGAAGYDIWLTYDSNVLQYTGSDARVQATPGSLHVVDYDATGNATKLQIALPFHTLAAATTTIKVAQQILADNNADTIPDVVCGYSTIQIVNPPTYSSDSSLKALTVSPGTLSPQFSAGTTNYSMTVSSSTTKLAVSATANHSKAKVSVSGHNNLQVGTNWVTVTVVAEDGSRTNYSIKVTRNASVTSPPPDNTPAVTPTPDAPEAYVVLPDGSTAPVANEIPQEKIPVGFDLSKATVDGLEVPVIVYHEDGMPAVYLEKSDTADEGFYFVDTKTGEATPMESVSSKLSLILLDVNLAEIPEGYELGKFPLEEETLDALTPAGQEVFDHCLVFGMNGAGEQALYRYDPKDGTFQRYIPPVEVEEPQVDPTPTPETTPELTPVPTPGTSNPTDFFSGQYVKYVCIALVALVVLFLILTILFAVLYEKKANMCRQLQTKHSHEEKMDSEQEFEMMFGHHDEIDPK